MEQQKTALYKRIKKMDDAYSRLRSYILCSLNHPDHLNEAISFLTSEIDQNNEVLRNTVLHSYSPALAMQAGIHLNYCERMDSLRRILDSYAGDPQYDQATILSLYADNSMSFVSQVVRFALIATLEAIDLQAAENQISEKSCSSSI